MEDKTSYILPLEDAKRGCKMLVNSGMKKLNLAGGEPFLYPKFVGELARYCKSELNLHTLSIITNGSKLNERWLKEYARFVDIMGISCDSQHPNIMEKLGRGKGEVDYVEMVRLCKKYGLRVKINTVVTSLNWQEDMNDFIGQLAPYRWKVFQCLPVEGENIGENALRNVESMLVNATQYQTFIDKHKHQRCLVVEENDIMQSSYVLLDEYMRFLDCSGGGKSPSKSILHEGVYEAFHGIRFDQDGYQKRNGDYFEW